MDIFLLVLIIITIGGMQFWGPDSFNCGYIEKDSTTTVNGIFVILVIFSHYVQYISDFGQIDQMYLNFRGYMSQMVVVTFLFYSGYGMMESIKVKGIAYINRFPRKAIKLLIKFDIAVVMYWILSIAFGANYSLQKVIMALLTWDSVGNSNWYITAIISVYLMAYIAFAVCNVLKKRVVWGGIILLFLTLAWIYGMMVLGREAYCYNTIIVASCGFFYSISKEKIERFLTNNDINYYVAVMCFIGIQIVSYMHRDDFGIEGYTIWALSFVGLVLLFTLKVKIDNGMLLFFGKHVFSIYILQRLPMTVFSYFGFIESHPYISLIAVISITIPLALVFEKITDKITRRI